MDLALTTNRDLHPFTEGVHHRHADTVQATRHLVATGSEFAAGVQHREHGFQRALAGAGVHVGGNAPTVVGHRRRSVLTEHNKNLVAVARQGLINGVVDNCSTR